MCTDLCVLSGESWLRLQYESPPPSPDQISRLQSALAVEECGNYEVKALVVEVHLDLHLVVNDTS